jgi:hypothetical protein
MCLGSDDGVDLEPLLLALLTMVLLSPSSKLSGLYPGRVRSYRAAVLKPGKRRGGPLEEPVEDDRRLRVVERPGSYVVAGNAFCEATA